MRIWDLPPRDLCRLHLLGEHRELHAIWTVLTEGKTGYRRHPETQRWAGALKGLFRRHEELVGEIKRRGYIHRSPLDRKKGIGLGKPTRFIDSSSRQRSLLKNKGCSCNV